MSTIISLREQLAKAAEDRKVRIAAEEAAKAAAQPVVTPVVAKPMPTPKDLSVEVGADDIIVEIAGALKELPGSLANALDVMPELKAVVEEVSATAPGLMSALEKRYAPLLKRQERRKKIAAFKKRIADLLTERLPYGLAKELVEFKALVEISSAQNNEIQAANKAAYEKKGKLTFVRQALEKGQAGKAVATHYYIETEEWLADTFRAHHTALKRSERTWQEHLAKLGISGTNDSKNALLRIAMGEKLAAVAYLPYERRLKIDGLEVFGKYLVEGIDPDGNVPQMIFVPLEGSESLDECESPMYFATRNLDGGVFQFTPLRSGGKPEFAFSRLQEKSGKPYGLAKKILMGSLGVEERKHDDRRFSDGERVAYSSGPATSHRPDMAVKFNKKSHVETPIETQTPAPVVASPAESRKVRRAKSLAVRKPGDGVPKTSRPTTKSRGGASDVTGDAIAGKFDE